MRDMQSNVLPEYSIYPAALGAAAKTGDAVVDLQGFEGALILCGSGAITADMAFQLMECDTSGGTYTAVADADLVGSEPTLLEATDNEIASFAYIGMKRYLRVDTTVGTGIGWAAIVKGLPRRMPAQ